MFTKPQPVSSATSRHSRLTSSYVPSIGHDRRAIGEGVVDLGRLEVGRDEHVGREAGRGGRRGRGTSEVAGRGAGERRDAELDGARGRDGDGPVLEAQRGVARVVLDPEPLETEGRRQPIGGDKRGGADRQRTGGDGIDREELDVPPDPGRASAIDGARQRPADHGQVVRHLERPETGRTDVREPDRRTQAAVAAAHAEDARPRARSDGAAAYGVSVVLVGWLDRVSVVIGRSG